MSTFRLAKYLVALTATTALAGPLSPALAATDVGVTAAVNPQARGTPPGGATRTLVLGDEVIHRERIQTQGQGLVQVLLVDGSTFTVGPNSDLVIDEFVYDPNAGSGRLVASFSKGVARFVGGKLSKNEGGVSVNTPVGTIGIRGGIANLNVSGNGPAVFSLIFGDELTFLAPDGTRRRVFERGYSIEAGLAGGSPNVRRTRPSDLGQVQQSLTSGQGQNGGARQKPNDGNLDSSGLSDANSNLGYTNTTPPPKPQTIASTQISEVDTTIDPNEANSDTIDDDVTTETVDVRLLIGGDYPVLGGSTTSSDRGLFGGSTAQDRVVTANVLYYTDTQAMTLEADIRFDYDGYTIQIPLSDPGFAPSTGSAYWMVGGWQGTEEPETLWTVYSDTFADVIPSSSGNPDIADNTHAGFLWLEPNEFVFSALFMDDGDGGLDTENAIYSLLGDATDFSQYFGFVDEDNYVRTYTLSGDPVSMLRNGFEHDLFFVSPEAESRLGDAFLQDVATSGVLVIEPGDSTSDTPRLLASSFLIQGTGESQKSAISVMAQNVFEQDGVYQSGGSRRGGYRANATDRIISYGGGVSTLADANGDHIFGDDADYFVIGYDTAINDAFFDSSTGSSGTQPFGTLHVGKLTNKQDTSGLGRTTRTLQGFAAGLFETSESAGGMLEIYVNNDSADVTLAFDAVENTMGAEFTVERETSMASIGPNAAIMAPSSRPDAITAAFGNGVNGNISSGGSAFVDDDRFGARQNRNASRNNLDFGQGGTFNNASENAHNYLISNTLVPGADDDIFSGVSTKCTCAFMEWGYWGAEIDTEGSNVAIFGSDGRRRDETYLATYVAGEIATADAVATGGAFAGATASYAGHAVGNVSKVTTGGVASYVAAGDVSATWNFGSRSGNLSLDFDGHNLTGSISDTSLSGSSANAFSGSLSGMGTSGSVTGTTNGAFATNGSDPAAGVMGNFGFGNSTYQATGVYVGERQTAPPL